MNTSLTKFLTILTLLVGAVALSFAGPPEPMGKNVMPAPPPCDWHGFYIGLNVGAAGLQTDIVDKDDFNLGGTTHLEDTNVAGGGQVGYNWQKGAFVFGLEVDADYLNTEKSFATSNGNSSARLEFTYHAKVDFQGSARARAGIAVDNALIYATSGVAVSHGDSRYHEFGESEAGHQENARQDDWQAGFVGGVGVEYKFNCSWSARMEALYFHYPESTDVVTPGGGGDRFSFQNDDYTVRFGINYLFGGGH